MRHMKAGRKLGRNPAHRLALFRNLALALFRHERIITTVEKAKAVRPFVERLITLAKKGELHHRRLATARMGPAADAEVKPAEGKEEGDKRTIIQKLFADIGPRFKDRPGGYTRILKRHERRLGDGGRTAYLELLKEGEVKRTRERAAPAPAPAPKVEEQPKPAAPPAEQPQAGEAPQGEQNQPGGQ